ncbi:DUF1836 domain-containing protein [Helcococcus kunzii]|uniref:DUF1836 domain-containing protein n=1 Tax=Helcococcus kunzii ATCC 51366 TaxID=883114 RepID=H3NQS5_9FIRM|nr:DUF1836 domain-containing protein [Helcococcus kunzii]EHR32072.1 hypothetical protein HMPREF9709_01686 [Helcococcus kunzii ATCC 51366]QZO76186.1 DUF1836 domain-containing protein [Helcococcus kunzii]
MKNLINFQCPKWEDLPNEGLRSSGTIKYIESCLKDIYIEEPIITNTMIQNYRRWGLLDRSEGRLYYREDIAKLIVISIYKQVISIENINKGFNLAFKQMTVEKSFNSFSKILTENIQSLYKSMDQDGNFTIENKEISSKEVGVASIAYAYSMKLLGNLIIRKNGIENIRGKDNG